MENNVVVKVDRDTAMSAVCMVLSRAIIYNEEFDFNYKDGVLTTTYNNEINRKMWITDRF